MEKAIHRIRVASVVIALGLVGGSDAHAQSSEAEICEIFGGVGRAVADFM